MTNQPQPIPLLLNSVNPVACCISANSKPSAYDTWGQPHENISRRWESNQITSGGRRGELALQPDPRQQRSSNPYYYIFKAKYSPIVNSALSYLQNFAIASGLRALWYCGTPLLNLEHLVPRGIGAITPKRRKNDGCLHKVCNPIISKISTGHATWLSSVATCVPI